MKMSWIVPRIGKVHAVYVVKNEGDVHPRMIITFSGTTNIRMGWYPIGEHEYDGALALKTPDEIDDFASEMLKKYEKRLVA